MAQRANPLAEGLGLRRKPEACALVIFGASGDLTRRKLFPALYALAYGVSCRSASPSSVWRAPEQTTRQFVSAMRGGVREHARDPYRADVWKSLAAGIRYVSTDFADDRGEDTVGDVLVELDSTRGTAGNRLHYLAVPPQAFETVLREIGERRTREAGWTPRRSSRSRSVTTSPRRAS